MVSEVKGTGSTPVSGIDQGVSRAARTGQAAPAPGAPAEVVTLTDLAARLQRLSEQVERLPVVDQARVQALRDAIENGDYRSDPSIIAEKLSAFEQLLGGSASGV